MDGPELVPCEKLDPIPNLRGGPLPRFCKHFAMAYYALVLCCSCVAIIIVPKFIPAYVESRVWIETLLFSLFWSVLVVEILLVVFCALVGSVKNLCKNLNLSTTLEELFPTIDAASVDDYVYKNEAGATGLLASRLLLFRLGNYFILSCNER